MRLFGWFRRKQVTNVPHAVVDGAAVPCAPAAAGSRRAPTIGQGDVPGHDDARETIASEMIIDGVDGGRRLSYDDAARAFLGWLQARDETGEIQKPRLQRLYATHCGECRLAMLPDNHFFRALGKIAARHERRVPGSKPRRRVTTYDIPFAARAELAVPVKMVPRSRRAAA